MTVLHGTITDIFQSLVPANTNRFAVHEEEFDYQKLRRLPVAVSYRSSVPERKYIFFSAARFMRVMIVYALPIDNDRYSRDA